VQPLNDDQPAGARRNGPRRAQLSDEAANHVRQLIMSGQLRTGEFIRQERIAEELEMSATPVREGLLALRGEGFVELRPRKGYVVAPLFPDDIRDLFTAQALLAGELAARAAPKISPGSLERLFSFQKALQEAGGDGGDVQHLERLNHAFHREINLAANSPRLSWMLSLAVRCVPHSSYGTISGWPQASEEDHEDIVAALVEGDPEGARSAMIHHIEHAGNLLANHLESVLPSADSSTPTRRHGSRPEPGVERVEAQRAVERLR
jgi:DNA-binding GntR family transcriptional regulator